MRKDSICVRIYHESAMGVRLNMREAVKQTKIDCTFDFVPEVFEKMKNAEDLHVLIPPERVQDLEYVDVSGRVYCKVKRLFDILISLFALAILLIPMGILALAIYIDDPGKVFFSQYRVGLHGKRFKLYKFRTMKSQTPKYLATAEMQNPNQYITRLGGLLRKTSLDELPQLFNVLKGDMSIIGPRPLISDEYEMHIMRKRFGVYNIRPGITGLAQVNGRDMMDADEKIHWDVRYIEKFGLKMDMSVLLTTIPSVLRKEGVIGDSTQHNGKTDNLSSDEA